MLLWMDYETKSEADLSLVGTYKYAQDPSTEVLMLAYAYGEEEVKIWCPHEGPMPDDLREGLEDPFQMIAAWYAPFERLVTKFVLKMEIAIDRWIDPSIICRYLSMPGKLEKVGEILHMGELKKDEAGKKLIQMFCQPLTQGGELTLFGIEPAFFRDHATNPREFQQFKDYCLQDVRAERAIYNKVKAFDLPDFEWENYYLDQIINDRGIATDSILLQGASLVVEKEKSALTKELKELTQLSNPNSVKQFLPWIQKHGYIFDSLEKKWVKRATDGEGNLDEAGKKALALRGQLSKSSTAKFEAFKNAVNPDGRVRHLFSFMGAARTGRWCLAEGSLVKIKDDRGVREIPIEEVKLNHLLWDGEQWVHHEGVVFSGDKETITWDGVTATPEHKVWVSETKKITLEEARAGETPLWRGEGKYKIYKATSPSGKSYFGLTGMSVKERWRKHVRRGLEEKRNHPFYNAIRKYGPEAFTIETVDYANTKEDIQSLEKYYIAKHPKNLLYNLSPGGEMDGDVGGKIFWEKMEADPEAKENYLKKLSDIKKANDWTDYAAMSLAGAKWRKENPRKAWKIGHRNLRIANRGRKIKPKKKELTLQERLVLYKESLARGKKPEKAKRTPSEQMISNQKKSKGVTEVWENRDEVQRKEIGDKISKTLKENAKEESEESKKGRMIVTRSFIDREKQGKAASEGIKNFWVELRKDPEKYSKYLADRAQTCKDTKKRKKESKIKA